MIPWVVFVLVTSSVMIVAAACLGAGKAPGRRRSYRAFDPLFPSLLKEVELEKARYYRELSAPLSDSDLDQDGDKIASFSRAGLVLSESKRDRGYLTQKRNQDRALVVKDFCARGQYLLGIFDGHGERGEKVSDMAMRETQARLSEHPLLWKDPALALTETLQGINTSLERDGGIAAAFAGTTAVVALLRQEERFMWLATIGDSRAIVGRRHPESGRIRGIALTQDQNPCNEGERQRIEQAGGYVSDAVDGMSSRVWLDPECRLVGLAMSRSIGDFALKRVGVIATPVVARYDLHQDDQFIILASDGVWEFISTQRAAELVGRCMQAGLGPRTTAMCLMEEASVQWSEISGSTYRDDISATILFI